MTLRIATVSRRRSVTVSYALVAAMAVLPLVPVDASSPTSPQGRDQPGNAARVENTQVVISGAIVNVTYDLIASNPQSTFEVGLEASQNGGSTYDLKPKAVTGDVGPGIRPGTAKKIVWQAAKDTDSLQLGQFRFRVAITPQASPQVAADAGTNKPASSQLTPATPRTGAAPQPRSLATGGRNPWIWPGIAMLGGGAALGMMAAAGPLQQSYFSGCEDVHDVCEEFRESNTPIVGAGLAIAAAGAVLMVLGRGRASRNISVTAVPKGFAINARMVFGK